MLMYACQCCSCIKLNDTYSTDTISSNYDVRSGSWTVSGGRLRTSSSPAMIIHNNSFPLSVRVVANLIETTSTNDTTTWRIIVAYYDDDNYLFYQCQQGSSGVSTISIGERISGSETIRQSLSNVSTVVAQSVNVCWIPSESLLTVSMTGPQLASNSMSDPGGDRVGYSVTSNASEWTADALRVDAMQSVSNATCPRCHCARCRQTAATAQVEFDSVSSGACSTLCSDLNSTTYVLNRDTSTSCGGFSYTDPTHYTDCSASGNYWVVEIILGGTYTGSVTRLTIQVLRHEYTGAGNFVTTHTEVTMTKDLSLDGDGLADCIDTFTGFTPSAGSTGCTWSSSDATLTLGGV